MGLVSFTRKIFVRALGLAAVGGLMAAAPVFTSAAEAQSGGNVRVGRLTCSVSGGAGFIITSSKALSCVFRGTGGRRDHYAGTIRKFGLDIGATTGGTMIWDVYATGNRTVAGMLAGTYAGVSGEATVVGGVGANVLVGGSRRSISLQPLSIQGQEGFNLALGVADLQLHSVR
ncbi:MULTISPECIES: DUF992 domain-containing protein [unclassified Chelatococcus]|uniref:DUF992 domain-containing protein n=1 Tax=unclassified Chelatococcus TaxID=2638111 RepID=UPI0020C168ED|nr:MULTISPECIES: DUF992 domain-containing protein [unclassified Chelatococcus]MCO5079509.1 DUF992 domain-containing protein [Chelatococcus sp.]CAH1665281.1 conserved exported hypothetical protein [Hyphomicrobiales bacterium]CAH1681427.1 conserved exported hypothetical protein [Hyphomicrobiales bacterium]